MKQYTIKRHLEGKIKQLINQYKCLILTGPRQVGKSTLLIEGVLPGAKKFNIVKLNNENIVDFAKSDPIKFFKENTPPLFIDEVQKAPKLFSYIKGIIDENDEKGQFVVTGSEAFELMKGVGDHLSTRAVVLTMQSLSNSEIQGVPNFEFIPNYDEFLKRRCPEITDRELFQRILRGSMPELIKDKSLDTFLFYETYIKSFVIKDMKEDWVDIKDASKFINFLKVLASQVGQITNSNRIAKLANINQKTAETWLNGLIAMGIIFYLYPYSPNALTKTTRNPKLYFYDTGLSCHLASYRDVQTLINSEYAGHIFEAYAVSEISKGFINAARNNILYYARKYVEGVRKKGDEKEIDLIIEGDGGILYPIEIKMNSTPQFEHFQNIKILANTKNKVGPMTLICQTTNISSLGEDKLVLPIHWI